MVYQLRMCACMPRVGSRQASLNLFDLHDCYFLCSGDKIMPVCL